MIIKQLSVSDNLQELPPNAGKAFPLTAYYSDLSSWNSRAVPWHWHRELEFLLVLQGRIEVFTGHRRYALSEGEGCFINRNVLHRMEKPPSHDSIYIDLLLDAELLGGAHNSVFEKKYLNPILESREVELVPFLLQNTVHRQILSHIRTAYEAVDTETEGFEIIARNELSSAWLLMRKDITGALQSPQAGDEPAELRVKKMMLYIQERFSEKLSLGEIASAANISTRECLRDFQRCLGTTPFHYLMDCRLDAAADLLLSTKRPVTEISGDCGFSSGSYFTKQFHGKFQLTPTEYRKRGAR